MSAAVMRNRLRDALKIGGRNVSSKYDIYWQKKLDEIFQLLKEAYESGQSSELDVSDLQIHGERDNWNGYVVVSRDGLRKGDMAHAKSLGKIILGSNKLLDFFGDAEFEIRISNRLKLNVVQMDIKKSVSPVPIQTSKKETTSVSDVVIETTNIPNGELDAKAKPSQLIGYGQLSQIPNASGIYTAWLEGEKRCFYVGKASNLYKRIRDHFSGQRGGDQFCLYVYDAYVHGERSCSDTNITSLQLNNLTRDWIRKHIKFRYIEIPKEEISQTETRLRDKLCPILNPLSKKQDLVNNYKEFVGRETNKIDKSPGSIGLDNKEILILFPCSGAKQRGAITEIFGEDNEKKATDYLDTTRAYLIAGRKGMSSYIDNDSQLMSALDRYSGSLYSIDNFKETVRASYLMKNVHILIMSGAYGILLPNERIHYYKRPINAQYWKQNRLPDVIEEYIEKNNISHVYGFFSFSTDYIKIMKGINWNRLRHIANLEIARTYYVDFRGSGGAQVIVPQTTGMLIVSFIKSKFSQDNFYTTPFNGQYINFIDHISSPKYL